jgi:hypothetical protein
MTKANFEFRHRLPSLQYWSTWACWKGWISCCLMATTLVTIFGQPVEQKVSVTHRLWRGMHSGCLASAGRHLCLFTSCVAFQSISPTLSHSACINVHATLSALRKLGLDVNSCRASDFAWSNIEDFYRTGQSSWCSPSGLVVQSIISRRADPDVSFDLMP